MGKKGKNNYVIAVVKNKDETPEMKEVFENMVMLKNTYLYLGSLIKKKKKKYYLEKEKEKEKPDDKEKEIESKVESGKSVNPPRAVPAPSISPFRPPLSSSLKMASLSQSDPSLENDISVMFSNSEPNTPAKTFINSDRSPKPLAKPVVEKKNTRKGGNPHPPSSKGALKEIPETPQISSKIDLITLSPKNKWNVDRHKWEKRRQSLVDRGCDLDDVRTGRADLQMWDGVSTKPADKRKVHFYVVWNGRTPGVFLTWARAQTSISGYSKAGYQKVSCTEREAMQMLEEKLKEE